MNLLNCGNQKNIITLEPKENMPPIDFYQFNRILFEDVD